MLLRTVPIIPAAALGLAVLLCVLSCSSPEQPAEPEYSLPHSTNAALLEALGGHVDPLMLGEVDGPQLLLTAALSGRVLGASMNGTDDENLMWVEDGIFDDSYWHTDPLFWNAGGLRSWLAPEDLFFVNEEKDPDSWFVPQELDPRQFRTVSYTDTEATFTADIDLDANIGETYSLTLTRRIRLLTDPPQAVQSAAAQVDYVGLEQYHAIENRADMVIGEDVPYICLWSLLQVEPSGTTLVPLAEGYDPEAAYREYFNPLGDRLVAENGIISVQIDGEYRSKIGIRPEAAGRGIAYLRDDGDGSGVLYAMLFPVDPNGVYVDKPWGTQSDYGDAIELYNDDGDMGGFAEIECHGPAQRLGRGDTQAHTVTLHMFRGPLGDLKAIAGALFGTDMTAAYYF